MAVESGYFSRFPKINYQGKEAIDITRRVRLTDSTLRQPTIFYPYTLVNEMRADSLAFDYYQDPDVEWVPYLTNGIIDPYYGWYLNGQEFAAHLENKYYPNGVDDTQLRIHHWVTNWAEASLEISVSYYTEHLPEVLKKYWIPNYGMGSKVLSYRRREEDWTSSTNRLVKYSITIISGPGFEPKELVDFQFGNGNVGFGEVVQVSDGAIWVKNLTGTTEGDQVSILGHGGTRASIQGSTLLSEDISLEELTYWTPVTVYEYENEKNEANKQITLISVDFIPSLLKEMREKLS